MGFMNQIQSVCVYCGSSPGRSENYVEAGRTLGADLARSGLRLVYGGGTKGIMGAVAEGTLRGGGAVTGIIPRFLISKEATEGSLQRLDELIITEDMHARTHAMFERSDAFVALPGGIGTVEEIVEIMTWAQLGRHGKPMVFANIGGFWDPMLALIDHMRAEGFLHSAERIRLIVVERADEIVPALTAPSRPVDEGDPAIIERL
jgi:uncharacterized protein (TIGR00730 family)